jgi:hypothetical protein
MENRPKGDPDRLELPRANGEELLVISGIDSLDAHVDKLGRQHYLYGLGGLIVGAICILAGVALFLLGLTGKTSWTISVLGARSQVWDAAPGVVLFLVGLLIVYATRPVVKIQVVNSAKKKK